MGIKDKFLTIICNHSTFLHNLNKNIGDEKPN